MIRIRRVWDKYFIAFVKVHIPIAFTQPHRPEDALPNSYDMCEPGLKQTHYNVSTYMNKRPAHA